MAAANGGQAQGPKTIAVHDFLNPASMMTPGVAGALTMMIANTVSQQFDAPVSWVALMVAFLCGAVVWTADAESVIRKSIFYVLNSLIIFCVAAGSSAGAASASSALAKVAALPIGIAAAWADETSADELKKQVDALSNELAATKKALARAKSAPSTVEPASGSTAGGTVGGASGNGNRAPASATAGGGAPKKPFFQKFF